MQEIFNPHNYSFTIYSLPTFIGLIYFLSIGTFVFLKHASSRVNLYFFLMCIASSIWQLGATMMFASRTLAVATFWSRTIGTGVSFIPTFLYLFAERFLDKRIKFLEFFALAGSTLFVLSCLFTYAILEVPRLHFYGYYLVAGRFHPLFLSFFTPTLGMALILLYSKYRREKSTGNKLKAIQARYILTGIMIYSLASVDFVPMYTRISLYPFGDIFVVMFISILAYSIIKYRAFDIETVIHRTLLWIITISVLILPPSFVFIAIFKNANFLNFPMAAHLAISAVFLLLFYYYYSRLRPRIDHLFRRRKYDYLEILGTIAQQISGIIDLEELSRKTVLNLKEVLYPRTIHLFLRDDQRKGYYLNSRLMDNDYHSFKKDSSAMFFPEHLETFYSLYVNQAPMEKELLHFDPLYKNIRTEAEELFEKTDSVLLLGLTVEEELVGFIFLGKKENLQPYTRLDINALHDLSLNIASSFYTSIHHHDILESQRLHQEITLAKHIQENLLPQESPRIPGLSVCGLYTPSKEIGGDYFDFIFPGTRDATDSENNLYITIGDVSGKGLDAGFVVSSVKSFLLSLVMYNHSCKNILNILNQQLFSYLNQQKFISLLLLQYVPEANTITYSSAGHEHLLIYRAHERDKEKIISKVEALKSGGVVLGMVNNIADLLEERVLSLDRGDKILLYTDGATEARNPQEELYGLSRLTECFGKNAHLPIKEAVHNIHGDIKEFISSREQYDDITLVGIEKK